jgi:hypothetical protein
MATCRRSWEPAPLRSGRRCGRRCCGGNCSSIAICGCGWTIPCKLRRLWPGYTDRHSFADLHLDGTREETGVIALLANLAQDIQGTESRHQKLVAARGQMTPARFGPSSVARPEAGLERIQGVEKTLHILAVPGMDYFQIEGRNGGSMQHGTDSSHDDEVYIVGDESPENSLDVKSWFGRREAS